MTENNTRIEEFHLIIYETYTNSWMIELKNSDDKLLVFENSAEIKEGVVTVIDKFLDKCPEYRKQMLELLYDTVENFIDCEQCNKRS